MQRLLMATALVVTFPFVASAADLQPGEGARELTTAELDSVTAGSSKRGGLLEIDLGVDADGTDLGAELGLGDVLDLVGPVVEVLEPVVVGIIEAPLLPDHKAPRHY